MSKENPLLKQVEENFKLDKRINETFERWFELHSSYVNPTTPKEEAKHIFREAFNLGMSFMLNETAVALLDGILKSRKKEDG